MQLIIVRRIAGSVAGTALLGAAVFATAPAQAADAPPTCSAGQIDGDIEFQGSAAGNRYARLVLTNQRDACTVHGYAGLELISADGRSLPTLASPRPSADDSTAEPAVVTLQQSGRALADLHWIVGPCFTAGDDGTPDSRPVAITVTAPGETAGRTLPWTYGAVCGEPEGPARIDLSPFRSAS